MARIRSTKPEFWTDEIIVQLPFAARLLFMGLWNFADDHGGLQDSAERIRMQVFPGDAGVDVPELLDLLVAAGLLERWVSDDGADALKIKNWAKHQRVDNPGKTKVIDGTYRKLAIPSEARRAVAIKYGCQPGERKDVTCFFCGLPGQVYWHRLATGKPSAWVTFPGLEIDHAVPEAGGGANSSENLILSCRACNRSRGTRGGISFMTRGMVASPIETGPDSREDSTRPRGRGEGKGGEGKGSEGRGREKEKDPEGSGPSRARTFADPEPGISTGMNSPPSDPSRRRTPTELRRNGDFEKINDGVSKLLETGVYTADKPAAIAQALHVSTHQVEVAIGQLRDRGQLPTGVAA